MPNARQRATAASVETKALLPDIPRRSHTDPTSYFYAFTEPLPPLSSSQRQLQKLRTAVIEGGPLDVAIDWQNYSFPEGSMQNTSSFPFPAGGQGTPAQSNTGRVVPCGLRAPPVHFKSLLQGATTNRVLVLNTANERKPGGDWDGGIVTQEEEFSRRSNLVGTLTSTDPRSPTVQYYPIPQTGAVYSPSIVVFRDGPSKGYTIWDDEAWTTISILSAPAVRRPKTDDACMRYSFDEEKNLQKEKMKTVLRVAALNGHINLVLGGFGSCGHEGSSNGLYRNPAKDVCELWKELLESEEFTGWFANIVFAFGDSGAGWAKDDKRGVEEFKMCFDPQS